LGPTSQMGWENRLASDMMLAEKGAICVMIIEFRVALIYEIIQTLMELLLRINYPI
jgi:hypothetical protein